MWNNISKEAFERIFVEQLTQALTMSQDASSATSPSLTITTIQSESSAIAGEIDRTNTSNCDSTTSSEREVTSSSKPADTTLTTDNISEELAAAAPEHNNKRDAAPNNDEKEDTCTKYDSTDIPVCSICDTVSLECKPLTSCSHPACPKCSTTPVDRSSPDKSTCRICVEEQGQFDTSALPAAAPKLGDSHEKDRIENKVEGTNVASETVGPENLIDSSQTQSQTDDQGIKQSFMGAATSGFSLASETGADSSRQDRKSGPKSSVRDLKLEIKLAVKAANQTESETKPAGHTKHEEENDKQPLEEVTSRKDNKGGSKEYQSVSRGRAQTGESIKKTEKENSKRTRSFTSGEKVITMEQKDISLSEKVKEIQVSFAEATKYSHCHDCLCAKKSVAPDLLCLDCALSFCHRCNAKHKSIQAHKDHIVVPVVESRHPKLPNLGPGYCLRHTGSDLALYCGNCEALVCRECVADKHVNCPGIASAQEYATEERETVKRYRVKYAQVMRFFLEQRRETEETMAALNVKKKAVMGDIRKFFSALIKACMDVEGSLMEELEESVADQTDLLKDQSSNWLRLQESTQQLLDLTDLLHFLPTGDFLPLSAASKGLLSHALRQGEELAAVAPPRMTLAICLEQSSQRSVVKRIKEIGAMALTVTTHNNLSLRKINSAPFNDPQDSEEPQVTAMILLNQATLLAADFNNQCLKLLHSDKGDYWNVAKVFPLKFRPYGLAKLSETSGVEQKQENPTLAQIEESVELLGTGQSFSTKTPFQSEGGVPKGQSVGDGGEVVADVAVSSPFAGCVVVSISTSGKTMSITKTVTKDKGCWGIAAMDENTLAISSVEGARTCINLINIATNSKQRLNIAPDSSLATLVSPRHLLATSPSSLIVCDHGRKSAIHLNLDGKVLFTFTGHGSQKLSRPEGLCMDTHGYIYIADSSDHSVSTIKGSHLFSKTGSQQSDLQCPQAVCIDKNSCLFVSNDGGKTLTVYDIIQESQET